MTSLRYLAILLFFSITVLLLEDGPLEFIATVAAQTPKDMIAAQIRIQGFVCDKAQRAVRDAKLSKPDHDVWVLTCKNATYRVSRYPDMAAKVELLR